MNTRKKMFRPFVTMLEGRQMLSSAAHAHRGGIPLEAMAKSNAHSISGTLEGTSGYDQPTGASGDPQYYDLGFHVTGGELNNVQMAGFGQIIDGVSGFDKGDSSINLSKDSPGGRGGAANWNPNSDHLELTILHAPFSPSATPPTSFNLLARVKTVNGVFKHDVGKELSIRVALSSVGDFTATFQPA